MTKTRIAKIAGIVAGAAFVLGAVAPMAQAVTVADLQAQIAALMAQIQALTGGSSSTSSTVYTRDLTIGSTGSDVTALQNWLISKGYSIPAGATGYFGTQTKGAVAQWQAASGITPAVGFFGPISRSHISAMSGGTTTTGGSTTGTTVGSITTPGVEGTLTVTAGTISNSTIYAGDSMVPVLAFKAKALSSDIAIQRVKVDLGTASSIYSKVYSRMYLVDESGNVLVSSDLNSSTVVKDSDDRYYITLAGFSSVVPAGTTKTFTLKVDVRNISTGSSDLTSHTVRLAADGVRGVDGAGIDQYSPTNATDVTKAVTTSATLSDSASLTLSTDANTPLTQEVIAAGGSGNNEADKVPLLTFDLQAQKDNITLTDLTATVAAVGSATASTTYLYAGNTLIGTASASTNSAVFNDVNYVIPKDQTQAFTIMADVRSAGATATTLTSSVATGGITATNSAGDDVSTLTGSATSNSITVRNVGPIITLVSKAITTSGVPESDTTNSLSTSTMSATFTVNIKAVGAAITFGSVASATPAFASSTTGFKVYVNGAADTTINANVAAQTSWDTPSSGVTTSGNSFTIAQNNSVTIPVTFSAQGRKTTGVALTRGSVYAVGLEGVQWTAAATGPTSSTFMAGLTDWRTSGVTFP